MAFILAGSTEGSRKSDEGTGAQEMRWHFGSWQSVAVGDSRQGFAVLLSLVRSAFVACIWEHSRIAATAATTQTWKMFLISGPL